MANVNVTLESGTTKNIYNDEAELVMIGPVTRNATGDTITITDAKNVYWFVPCAVNPTSKDMFYQGTSAVEFTATQGTATIHNAVVVGTGVAYMLALVGRE